MLYSRLGMSAVLVISREWGLRGAVRAELRHAGIDARGLESVDDLGRTIAAGTAPAAVVIDGAELQSLAARNAVENLAGRVALLIVDSRVSPAPPVRGALFLKRPVQVKQIVAWVLATLQHEVA